jgi:hypothetical protein
MSEFYTLEVIGDFYGVTASKGDIIVNDGIKNSNLMIGTDGYVLTADSTQAYGMKWSAPTGSTGNISSQQYILSNKYQTTSTTPVPLADFTTSPTTGSYIVMINLTISTARQLQPMTLGIYRNGLLVSNSKKTIQLPGSNIRYAFSSIFNTSFITTDLLTIRVNTADYTSALTFWEGNMVLVRVASVYQICLTTVFSTNSPTGVYLSEFTQTPQENVYTISLNLEYSLSVLSGFTICCKKNNTTITSSARTIYPNPNSPEIFNISFISSFSGTDVFDVAIQTQNTTTVLTVLNGTLIFIPIT